MQGLVSTLIVAACAAYAAWALLLPARWRRRVQRALGAQDAPTCGGCAGCAERSPPAASSKSAARQVVHWMPRRRG
jgi:hypothetical protein